MDNKPESELEKNTANKKNDLELKFRKMDLHEIQMAMKKLPLKPCIRCESYVNHDTHNRNECALFHHEILKERETSSEIQKIIGEKQIHPEHGNNSVKDPWKRKERQKALNYGKNSNAELSLQTNDLQTNDLELTQKNLEGEK